MGMKHGFLPWWKGKKSQAITCKVLMKTYESNKDEQLSTLYNDECDLHRSPGHLIPLG